MPILLRDIADIELEMEKRSSFRRLNGKNALILNALREQGTNVVQTMQTMQTVIDALNQGVLAQRGLNLKLVYDETNISILLCNLCSRISGWAACLPYPC